MSIGTEKVVIRVIGLATREFTLDVESYTTVRDFVTAPGFLCVTKQNPNKLTFFVNSIAAKDDLLLVSGDVVTFGTVNEKTLITPRDVIKKLRRLAGLEFDRHGKRHDHWRTQDGRKVVFPRHAGDLKIGTLRNIIKQAGLVMSIDEFLEA